MIIQILLSILFVTSLPAMENQSNSEGPSKQLYGVMIKAHNIVNKRSLLGDDGTFDPSEKSLLSWVQWLLNKRADPNYKMCFNVPMDGRVTSIGLPTSMELAQKLEYKDIVYLFGLSSKKEKLK